MHVCLLEHACVVTPAIIKPGRPNKREKANAFLEKKQLNDEHRQIPSKHFSMLYMIK